MKILEDLWYGNICPIEQAGYRSEDCKTLLELFNRNGTKLESTLNDDEKETLEKMRDCWMEMQQYAECGAFITGFRLAVQLMTASAGEPPDPRA